MNKYEGARLCLLFSFVFTQLRAEAEARANEEQTLREIDRERLRQLELIKEELERLLAEERQAKKDEEIVRALQARYTVIYIINYRALQARYIVLCKQI